MDSPNLNIGDFKLNTFHTGTELHTAAVNGDKITIERILQRQDDLETLNKGDKYGRTALVYTVFGNWFECAEILVRHGASLLQGDSDGRSVLHWAAYLDQPKFIKLFLEHLGPNLEYNFCDKDGRTALHYAAMQPNSKCLRLLVKRLILNERNLNATDNEQMTALHWSVFYNRLENFKLLTREGADTKKRDVKGRCLLHMAVLNPNADSIRIVRILLKLNRHFSRQCDKEKHTSLHLAVANGNRELVRELCQAEESALNYLDGLSRSALHYAVLKNDIDIINILISSGVSPYHVDNTGANVLHYAAKNNNVQIVRKFLDCFKNFEDAPDKQGRTALMWAASEDSFDVLKFMLGNLSYFNIHASDEQGLTALHFACFAGHKRCVELLIANSAQITQPDKLGQTPLFKACQQGHFNIIDILTNRKGSQGTIRGHVATSMDSDRHQISNKQGVLKDNTSMTGTNLSPIKEESTVNQDSIRNSGWSYEPTESLFGGETMRSERGDLQSMSKGDSCGQRRFFWGNKTHTQHGREDLLAEFSSERLPDIQELEDDNGCTPLHFAAHAGHILVCKWLLNQGVNPGKKDVHGRTALHGAAFNGHTECMALMLSHNPDLADDRDNDGYSVLHHAAVNGQLEAVKLLALEPFQAFLNYRVKSTNWTPLDFAMAADHQDVTQFLMDNGALTIDWLQDVAADKIKKFFRRLVLRKREATVKPLIERHKQLTKDHVKLCEDEEKKDCEENDVFTHDDITQNDVTRHDITKNTVINEVRNCNVTKRKAEMGCSGKEEVVNQQHNIENGGNMDGEKIDEKDKTYLRLESGKHRFTTDDDELRSTTDNKNTIHSDKNTAKTSFVKESDLQTFTRLAQSDLCDNNKLIALLVACYHGNIARVQKLVEENVDVNERDERGCTALHFATAQGHDGICEYLLDNGAEICTRDINGRTALHNAAIAGNIGLISLLLSRNKDLISYLDCDQRSALHYAARMGHLNIVKLLFSKDFRVQDVCAKSTTLTALDCAILGQHDDVIEYMISHGLKPSGLLDKAARVIQASVRKWLKMKTVKSKEMNEKDKKFKRELSKENSINTIANGSTQAALNAKHHKVKIDNAAKNSPKTKIPNHKRSKVTFNKSKESVTEKSSKFQTKSDYLTSKADQVSRPVGSKPIRKSSGKSSQRITDDSTTDDERVISRTINPTKSASKRSGTSVTFVHSSIENLSRAPDSVIIASGEKDKIFQLRHNWQRIALLRRKKQAALVIQKHFRKHMTSKRNTVDRNASKKSVSDIIDWQSSEKTKVVTQNNGDVRNSEGDHFKNGNNVSSQTLKPPTSPTEVGKNRYVLMDRPTALSMDQEKTVTQKKVDTALRVLKNETTSPKRLTRETVINRLRTTSPEHGSLENEASREKREYKSTFPLLSPKSSSASSNRSPGNAYSKQLPSNRHANSSSPSNRRADVAPTMSKKDLVDQWLSDGLVSSNSSNTKNTSPTETTKVEDETTNSEPTFTKPHPSRFGRRLSAQSARTRRDSLIKNAYGSPAAQSYNFALDTYHPLASRRGRKDTNFPFRTSSRVRPNSMVRVEGGWVRTSEITPGSPHSDT